MEEQPEEVPAEEASVEQAEEISVGDSVEAQAEEAVGEVLEESPNSPVGLPGAAAEAEAEGAAGTEERRAWYNWC